MGCTVLFVNSIFINFAAHASVFSGILDNYINHKHFLNNSCLLIVCRIIVMQRKIWHTPWNEIPCNIPEGNNLFSPFSDLFSLFGWLLASCLCLQVFYFIKHYKKAYLNLIDKIAISEILSNVILELIDSVHALFCGLFSEYLSYKLYAHICLGFMGGKIPVFKSLLSQEDIFFLFATYPGTLPVLHKLISWFWFSVTT